MQPYVPFHVQWSKLMLKFDMKLTCYMAFTFVMANFLIDKPCRPQTPLLIYALYLMLMITSKLIGYSPLFSS